MSEFEAKKLNVANINSGQKYQNGDGLQAKSFNELVEATLQNSNDIDFIDMILEGSNIYAELELSEAYTSRVTANGANIFDDQLTPVLEIAGSTVKTTNLFDISKMSAGSGGETTHTDRDITVTDHFATTNNNLKNLIPNLQIGKTYTFCCKEVVSDVELTTNRGGVYIYSLSTNSIFIFGRVGLKGKITIDENLYNNGKLGFWGNSADVGGGKVTWKDFQVLEGDWTSKEIPEWTPYFAGLKNAYINSIVSTGKNLFSLDKFMEVQTSTNITRDGEDLVVRSQSYQESYTVYNFPLVLNTATMSLECETTRIEGNGNFSFRFIYEDGTLERKMIRLGQVGNIQKIIFSTNKNVVAWGFGDWQYNGTVILRNIQIQIGNTATEYEPYTTYTYQLPQTVELGEFDTIYPEKGVIERFTKLIDFTNEYTWSVPTEGLIQYNNILYPSPDLSQPLGQGICNLFEHATEPSDKDMTWYFQGGMLYFAKKGITNINEWTAYLSTQASNGNPLVLAYKTNETSVVEPCNAPQAYEVYNGGTETVSQGEIDNSQYGALPTITQTYIFKVGS
jgi:hypothetical protein